MQSKLIFFVMPWLFLLLLGACSQTQVITKPTNMTKISVYDLDDTLVLEMSDAVQISSALNILDKRVKSFDKLLPIFTHKLVIERENELESWLFNKSGYLIKDNDKNGQLFLIDAVSLLSL